MKKKKPVLVSACRSITTKQELIEFLESLPHYVSTKRTEAILLAIQNSEYRFIVWAEKKRFRVW